MTRKRPQQLIDEDEKSLKEKDYGHIENIRSQKGRGYYDQLQVFINMNGRILMKQIHYDENLSDGFDHDQYDEYDLKGFVRFQDVTGGFKRNGKLAVARHPHNPVSHDILSCEKCHQIYQDTSNLGEGCKVCGGRVKLWESERSSVPVDLMNSCKSMKEEAIAKQRWMSLTLQGKRKSEVRYQTEQDILSYRKDFETVKKSRHKENLEEKDELTESERERKQEIERELREGFKRQLDKQFGGE